MTDAEGNGVETAEQFSNFGGLRLDLPVDEVGPEQATYLRDVIWDGSLGRLRTRDGFQKLKAVEATGEYKALFPHSALRLIATKRISPTECKVVAIDKEGTEKAELAWPATAAKSSFTHLGTPTASYTYGRANVPTAKTVRFDGTTFTEPTAKVGTETGKEMPKGALYAAWGAGGNRLVVANTGSTGGPGGAASSNSHVWFSAAGAPEEWETTAYVILGAGDGEEITAVCSWGNFVLVFKETKFFRFYGVSLDEEAKPEFNFTEVSLGEGSRMKRATSSVLAETSDQIAAAGRDGVYFCTTDGIYVTAGGPPSKISEALKPLEEVTPFEGAMSEFLNGTNESFRWPATGITCIGTRVFVRRYEFMFVYDAPLASWACWKMPSVSAAVWTGLTGGGAEVSVEKFPGTAEDNAGTGTVAWTNVSNIKSLDGAYATSSLPSGARTHYAVATNLGFSIPTGATIVGVRAVVYRRWNLASELPEGPKFIEDFEVKLVKGGVISGINHARAEAWTSSRVGAEYGGPEDLWGIALTQADVNSATFGFAICASNTNEVKLAAAIDAMAMSIYYLTAESSSGVRPRLFCTQSKSVFWTGPTAEEQATSRSAEWQPGWYDFGSPDEKSLTTTRLWGKGEVTLEVGTDFGALERPQILQLGVSTNEAQFNKAQTGSVFTHRLKLGAGASVQRLVRYLRETQPPTTKTN